MRGDESEGYAYLLELVFEELALELPGLYGSNGVADLIPVGPATLRHLVESLDDPALAGCWTDDMTPGWVYQYWNDPEREALDAKLHAGGKVEPPEIASKTRMFTERYMVDWLLQNSLGPMWLAMSLAHDVIGIDDAWSQLSGVPDFRGITDEEFFRLVGWMRGEQSMLLLGGRLVVGPKIERTFGRRNFMDLYSVFSSPQSYAVRTTHGQPLGSLNQDFVDRLVDEVSCFLLSGRAGAVVRFQHSERQVIVEAAPRGRQPTWAGCLPQFLSHSLCQRILAVLTSTEDYPYLSQPARDALAVKRDEVHDILEPCIGGIEVDDGEIRWWTYAGGTINSTLRHAIAAIEPDWKVTADNLLVRFRGEGVNGLYFSEALRQLGSAGFWEDTELWQVISRNLPGYRLSKFQPLMPSWVERETLERYLLDLEGTRRWLARSSASHDGMAKEGPPAGRHSHSG